MAPKGGGLSFLLIAACAALVKPAFMMPDKPNFKYVAQKLMNKCQDKGYPMPKMMLLSSVFGNREYLPAENRSDNSSNRVLKSFLGAFKSATATGTLSRVPSADTKTWNCTYLQEMIRLMRNSSEASACYMRAFVAPVSWTMLTRQGESGVDSDDYDALLWAAKPALPDMPSSRMNFPTAIQAERLKKMMSMLREVHDSMSDDRRARAAMWAKMQLVQNNFNCTPRDLRADEGMKPPVAMEQCKPSLKWLTTEAMTTLGPYLSDLEAGDVDSSAKEALCQFFFSAKLNSTLSRMTAMHPSLGKRFLQRIQECVTERAEFLKHVDKLGILACYYYDAPFLTANISRKLLSELDNCKSPRLVQLKRRLVGSVMSSSTTPPSVRKLGSSVALLSPKQLLQLVGTELKGVLKDLGPNVQWTKNQLRTLIQKQLGDRKCEEISGEDLMALQSIAKGLPSCALKRIKAQGIVDNPEALKKISQRMRKGQLKAMLQGLRGNMTSSELVKKLSGRLLQSVSLNSLKEAGITSLDQVENKTWSQPQAVYLAKKMYDSNQLQFRRLRSVLQGVTCRMMDRVADRDTQDMAQAVTETPQWLSKLQARCAARKLFVTLEKERADYFLNITGEELDMIPTLLLLHLPPSKVKNLPDSACPVFLDKMEVANLSSLPLRAPSRPEIVRRALRCLANGEDLSVLTAANVSALGQLLCELSASQLRLLAPDVLASGLRAMASCQRIPEGHRADLIELMNEIFGDPSAWSAETMEALGPVLLSDDNATAALPNRPWMKDVLHFLRARMSRVSDALKKKLFDLTTTAASDAARRKREADFQSSTPTVELIEELGMDNVYWPAAQLDAMSVYTFKATVEILGDNGDYNADQLSVLRQKAIVVFGPVSQMTEGVVLQLGCITQGFSVAELETLPFSLDSLEEIAQCGWNESQIASVWMGVSKHNNLTAKQLGATEMVALDQFICGLEPSQIQQLNKDAFKEAVGSMDGLQCSYNVTQQLKVLAVSVLGSASTWTEAQVSDLGNIMSGLDATEWTSLSPSVFSFLSGPCIALIPPENFAALSVAQLEALGPDNAAMVTAEQHAQLSDEQRASLKGAETGVREQTPAPTNKSGSPALSTESSFVKPLLFFLAGFLLL